MIFAGNSPGNSPPYKALFQNNVAGGNGGGVQAVGGVTLIGTQFISNSASSKGGGVYASSSLNATGGLLGVESYHWTQVDNIKRDPFETAVGANQLSLLGMGGALAAPSTAYIYDWNLLPIGQRLSSLQPGAQ